MEKSLQHTYPEPAQVPRHLGRINDKSRGCHLLAVQIRTLNKGTIRSYIHPIERIIPTALHRTPLTQSSALADLTPVLVFFSSDNSTMAFSSASENLGVSATLS